MPKWNKEAKEFEVSISYSEKKGSKINMPKPILELLGKPLKVKFIISGKKILVE